MLHDSEGKADPQPRWYVPVQVGEGVVGVRVDRLIGPEVSAVCTAGDRGALRGGPAVLHDPMRRRREANRGALWDAPLCTS